jgi:flagellar biosynthesis/type III secretory pathway protein FliH
LSDMIRTFTFNPFSDVSQAGGDAEFVTFFDKASCGPQSDSVVADLEGRARTVFEDAFVQGEKAGFEMGMKKTEPLVKRLNTYIAELSSFRKELAEKTERLSVQLALMFAETIVLKECSENREILVDMARKALEICDEKGDIVIRVSREDSKYISGEMVSPLTVVADDTLKEPGFIIETSFGDIDGRISTQMEELTKKVLDGYAR